VLVCAECKDKPGIEAHIASKHGPECAVCHAPILPSEVTKGEGETFCASHDLDALKAKREAMAEIEEEHARREGERLQRAYEARQAAEGEGDE
jgi:hypothetical protein